MLETKNICLELFQNYFTIVGNFRSSSQGKQSECNISEYYKILHAEILLSSERENFVHHYFNNWREKKLYLHFKFLLRFYSTPYEVSYDTE